MKSQQTIPQARFTLGRSRPKQIALQALPTLTTERSSTEGAWARSVWSYDLKNAPQGRQLDMPMTRSTEGSALEMGSMRE